METMEKKQAFIALSKICLNNWHYIDKKILSFNEGINFFTGHSGSGKSTVIDAMQIVLYANTDGRGFFNKAAADDSDRSLIEYLRGMVNISENNESQYLRNKNFSTTIVLEFENSLTKEKQCAGVVFDVETSTNEISRLFFWHRGGLLENAYRTKQRCLSTMELKEYFQKTFRPEEYYCAPSNERFRRQLYDVYLGGLDMEKFPRLFKRAIPFRMNIKLEDFVKEYICMEQDIHIGDLQESVMQYGNMRNKIEETMEEVRYLHEIQEAYSAYAQKNDYHDVLCYEIARLTELKMQAKIAELQDKIAASAENVKELNQKQEVLGEQKLQLQKEYEELLIRLNDSGYDGMKKELEVLNENIDHLNSGKLRWEKAAEKLAVWKEMEVTSNQIIWDIEKFESGDIDKEELERLKESLINICEELQEEQREAESILKKIKSEERDARNELAELKQGRKAYPKEVEEAKLELQNMLRTKYGKFIGVKILADLLDVKDERWHNAVEGYMGNNKLLLIVEPQYAKDAMEIYRQLDKKRFCRVSVLDTEKVMEENHEVRQGSLAEEIIAKEPYVQAYIRFFLGNVIKCNSIEELRECRIGITPECVLYHSYRLMHINPENYTRRAYIGEMSMRKRIKQLELRCDELQEERIPLQSQVEEIKKVLSFERLSLSTEEYMSGIKDARDIPVKEARKQQLIDQMEKLREEKIEKLEIQMKEVEQKKGEVEKQAHDLDRAIFKQEDLQKDYALGIVNYEKMILEKKADFDEVKEAALQEFLEGRKTQNYEYLENMKCKEADTVSSQANQLYDELVEKRGGYLRKYPNRTFSTTIKDNDPYDKLLSGLECEDLEVYKQHAKEQAGAAVEHFKDDFVFKIRSAIREAYQRKDELNRIISKLDFGKDKYQFVITRNKGADGKYYRMFMDDSLQINPASLGNAMENQMDMFTMEHEREYGDMMNELINIFIPPENATREEMDEARRNMEKYADYRTYLSFDMQQIVHGEKEMTIGLGKMIKKNSGGEGQNPLYVALLASFAQIYRVNLSPKVRRPATLRLVVLDEAFSKMDSEKVASCISLIRGLGFQAIISATNDKIQNYLENVDKTFVYANPDKRHISIQEFEKMEFTELIDKEE